MQFVGIDIGSETHVVAIVGEDGKTIRKPISFQESAEGYQKLQALLPPPGETLIGLEATGHYWRNLYLSLVAWDYKVAVINPLRTKSFGGEDLQRTKTDAVDAFAIARFVREKRPAPTGLPNAAHSEIRELVRLRTRLQVDLDAVRNALHRQLDLSFPEFTGIVKDPACELGLKLLDLYPTAAKVAKKDPEVIARVQYDERHHTVGHELAMQLVRAAKTSVGRHQGTVLELQTRQLVAQARLLKAQIAEVEQLLNKRMDDDDLSGLLKSIPGIGNVTAAMLIGEFEDFSRFERPEQLVAFAGANPGLRHSGKRTPAHAPMSKVGSKWLRRTLYMAALVAIRYNTTIRALYERLVQAGKPKKVAIGACIRKLLHIIYAVAKRGTPFVEQLPTAIA